MHNKTRGEVPLNLSRKLFLSYIHPLLNFSFSFVSLLRKSTTFPSFSLTLSHPFQPFITITILALLPRLVTTSYVFFVCIKSTSNRCLMLTPPVNQTILPSSVLTQLRHSKCPPMATKLLNNKLSKFAQSPCLQL
jgi:hypothetical protein